MTSVNFILIVSYRTNRKCLQIESHFKPSSLKFQKIIPQFVLLYLLFECYSTRNTTFLEKKKILSKYLMFEHFLCSEFCSCLNSKYEIS